MFSITPWMKAKREEMEWVGGVRETRHTCKAPKLEQGVGLLWWWLGAKTKAFVQEKDMRRAK